MKTYTFKIGAKTLELISPSVESAYLNAESFKLSYGWKGRVILIEIQ